MKRVGLICGEIHFTINIFVFQTVREGIFSEGKTRGEHATDGLWGPGKASNDTKESGGRCDSVEPDNSCIENCLQENFKGIRPRYTVLPDTLAPVGLGLFKNCQDWSDDALKSCRMKCSGNDFGRLIRFILTGVI